MAGLLQDSPGTFRSQAGWRRTTGNTEANPALVYTRLSQGNREQPINRSFFSWREGGKGEGEDIGVLIGCDLGSSQEVREGGVT